MDTTINVKTLRRDMGRILARVRRGERFTLLHRSRPACRIVPLDEPLPQGGEPTEDPLYGAAPFGASGCVGNG